VRGGLKEMEALTQKVLGMFEHWNKETLDLHELFEAGGNDPDARTSVFDTVERLVREGLIEERGNDFYALTEEGKRAARAIAMQRDEA
jgi:DNA-binding PadR family transcriptional regulator